MTQQREVINQQSAEKTLLPGCSKRSKLRWSRGARKIDERRRTRAVRRSEAIERNEVDEAFSAAC